MRPSGPNNDGQTPTGMVGAHTLNLRVRNLQRTSYSMPHVSCSESILAFVADYERPIMSLAEVSFTENQHLLSSLPVDI